MSNENADLIRRAYQAYVNGELATMLEFVDPDLEWTYLDPSLEDPEPQVCRGRHELESALEHQAEVEPRTQPAEPGRFARVVALARRVGALAAPTT